MKQPPRKSVRFNSFPRAAQGTRHTTEKREIRDEHSISSLQPDTKFIVLPEVAIHFPAFLICALFLNFDPSLALDWN
jgi:hypothetical protein